MDFFGIGLGEVLLILVLALIIWGPHKLPEIARFMGKATRAFKKASFDITSAVTKELDLEDKTPPKPGAPDEDKPETSPSTDRGAPKDIKKPPSQNDSK